MIYISFKKNDLRRWLQALTRVELRVKQWGMDEMQRRCAIDYYQLLAKNILERTTPIPPYDERYAKWKRKYGRMGYPSPWRLFGDLLKNLTAFRYGEGWMGGVPPGIMGQRGKSWFGKGDMGTPKEIVMYGSIEEKRRPVFEPTMREYAGSGWKRRGLETLQVIKKAWR